MRMCFSPLAWSPSCTCPVGCDSRLLRDILPVSPCAFASELQPSLKSTGSDLIRMRAGHGGVPLLCALKLPRLKFDSVSTVLSSLSRLVWCTSSSEHDWLPDRSLFVKTSDVNPSLPLIWSCKLPNTVSSLAWRWGCWWRNCEVSAACWSRRISSSISRICHGQWML